MFTRYLFIGGGLRHNYIFNTEVIENGLIAQNMPTGFNGSTSVGIEAASLYDSRNNLLNPSTGWYIESTFGIYDDLIGSSHNFRLLRYDFRHYISIQNKIIDFFAFQTTSRFSRGEIPFSEYSFFGSSVIMRGYREGRFVDRDMIETQVEYRKSFYNSRFGAVAFVGFGNIYDNISNFSFDSLKPNYGVGLIRFKKDKSENLNTRLDWGFGENKNNT